MTNNLLVSKGLELIQEAKVGAIILAGGHGSRLGHAAPKGCFALLNKSLYQILTSRMKAGCKLGVMTSTSTHDATVAHFTEHNLYTADFFMQDNLPLQDEAGNILQETAPDGNGALFWHFAAAGLLDKWEADGIRHITVCNIDNALADPLQPELIGQNELHNNDVTLVAIKREAPKEHVGVIIQDAARVHVVEYSEMADSERLAVNSDGSLKYPLANISYFVFSVPFIKKILSHKKSEMPLHKAKKQGRIKSEYFIFDLLAFSNKTEVLILPRNECFAPLKSPQDIERAERALSSKGI